METLLLALVLVPLALALAALEIGLAALTVAGPPAWYRRLRYGSPRPVIILDIETGMIELIGFHRRGAQRVARTVYLMRDTFPGTGPTPRALTLVHCPRDLMPFLQGDDTAGWLVEHRG